MHLARVLALAILMLSSSARAESPHVMLGLSSGFILQQPVRTHAQTYVDEMSPSARVDVGFRFTFTKQWEGLTYGSFGWVVSDAADEAGVAWFEMAAAARVRPLAPDSPWWVQFGALTGIDVPRGGDTHGVNDYLGVTASLGASLDRGHFWDLGFTASCRIDTELGDLSEMLAPSFELRLGVAL